MRAPLFAVLLLTAACGDDDAVPSDAGAALDATVELDAGAPLDASAPPDVPVVPDTGPPDAGFTGPSLLSETGLYDDIAARTLAPGVVEYSVRFELWSDGASKRRFLFLPEGGVIETWDPDRWRFPVGTRVWKEFHRDGTHVETRFLEKRVDGWTRVAYVWLEDGSDAVATPEGLADALGTPHDVPAVADCVDCHRGAADDLLGVSAIQLADPSGPDLLEALAAEGRLSDPLPAVPDVPGEGVVQQALGYMHANCGHCHNEDHPLAEHRTLRLWLPVGTAAAEDAPVYLTAIGARASHTIEGTTTNVVPGDPDASQLYVRMRLRDERGMPPRGTELEDPTGAATVRDWISGLP